jgi:hypothetical protein
MPVALSHGIVAGIDLVLLIIVMVAGSWKWALSRVSIWRQVDEH